MNLAQVSVPRFQSTLTSPLPGVSIDGWKNWLTMLEIQRLPDGREVIRPMRAISESGGFGSYDMRPRRLVELGYAHNLRYERTEAGRYIHTCDFLSPWTQDRFLEDPLAQQRAVARSAALYHKGLTSGELVRPKEASLAGVLAVLHRGGKGALKGFPNLFDETRALYEAARGAF